MRRFVPILVIMLLWALSPGHARADNAVTVNYTLVGTQTFDIINRYDVTNISTIAVGNVKLTALIGDTRGILYQKKLREHIEPAPVLQTTDAQGNVYGEFHLGTLRPGETKSVTVEKNVTNSGFTLADNLPILTDYTDFLADKTNHQYVTPSPHIESDAQEIIARAATFSKDKPPLERARDIYAFVNTYMNYEPNAPYAHGGALSALRTGRGVCTEFAGLFVALCRATGIPARIVSGYWGAHVQFPLNTPVDVSKDLRHAWAEFYLPTIGWVPVEPTIINTVANERKANPHYFAMIQPWDRHFIWAYGLDTERDPNINVTYDYVLPDGKEVTDTNFVTATLGEESVKHIPDEPAPVDAGAGK